MWHSTYNPGREGGDFYSLAGVIVDAEGDPVKPGDPKTDLTYRKGATKVIGHTRRVIKGPAYEKPHGQWNTLELYCLGQTSVHVVNGAPNMVLSGLRRKVDRRDVPLTKGRIQFQSEGAEVFYRNVAIRSIRAIPWKQETGLRRRDEGQASSHDQRPERPHVDVAESDGTMIALNHDRFLR